MAKGIDINGQLRGKRGGIVYYRANGEQISRTKASKVANPKSIMQQRQRAVFASVSQASSALRKIVDHSFEGVKYGQESLVRFAKENLAILANHQSDALNFTLKGCSFAQLNPYLISKGSLSMVDFILTANGLSHDLSAAELTALSGTITTQAQYETCLAALGCVPGDQLTIVQLGFGNSNQPTTVAERGNAKNYATYARIARVVFVNELPSNFSGNFILGDAETINPALTTRLEGTFSVVLDSENSAVIVNAGMAEPCAAIVRSQEIQSGKWARSYAVMQVLESYEGYALSPDVVPSYGASVSENVGSSEYYLNNALTANPTTGE